MNLPLHSSIRCSIRASIAVASLCVTSWSQAFYLDVPQAPKIPARTFKLTDYGGVGDGKTLNTEAFKRAMDACQKAGGGTVLVPSGTFVTGPINLVSQTALQLEKGAIIQASKRFSDFGLPDPLPSAQAGMDALKGLAQPLIRGSKLTDIAIRGEGVIDGSGLGWWALTEKAPAYALATPDNAARGVPAKTQSPPAERLSLDRPNMIILRECERVHIQGVTFLNPPMFHFVPSRCREILVEDVKIIAPDDSPNTDGIDPSNSSNILIRRCLIDTGDDNIALKSGGGSPLPTENVTITDCTFKHGHGVSIGSETQSGVRNILVQKCTFEGTDNGLRIKSDRKRGGPIENVSFQGISMKNVGLPITIFLYYDNKKEALAPQTLPVTNTTPALRNILFFNVFCDGATKRAGEIIGLPESPVTGVSLQDVRLLNVKDTFTIRDAKGVDFKNVEILTAVDSAASQTPASKPVIPLTPPVR